MYIGVVLAAIVIALVSYRYVFGLPPIANGVADNRFRAYWLAAHAGFASTALLVGAIQFSDRVPRRRSALHRVIGRIYVMSCLLGGGAGLVLALGTVAGPIASLGFGALAVAWICTNLLGWRSALLRQLAAHRRWMIRSWALTLSAVTLRIYLPLSEVMGLPDLDAYRVIAFLCWVPNLIVAEIFLHRDARRHAANVAGYPG